MENINEKIYNIAFNGKDINSKKLYEIITKEYSKDKLEYEINIKGEKILFKLIKNSKKCYELEFNSEKISFVEKMIYFYKDDKPYCFQIYCYKNLNSLLKHYKFLNPITYQNNKKIKLNKLNMEINDEDFKSLNYDTKIEEEKSSNNKNYLVTKEDYKKEKEIMVDLDINKEDFTIDKLGKYAKFYLKGIEDKENLFYLDNELMCDFESHTKYSSEILGIFNFLTGSEKSGKTFTLLCLNLFEFKEKYRIYLNDKFMTELEHKGKYNEMLEIFFYEISKIFKSYEDYENFSIQFLENIKETLDKIQFKELISKFIEELDLFIQKNRQKYNKMMIIFDEYELDETNPENFMVNNKFMTKLYNEKNNKSLIHFTFVSPINDNYMKKCILFAMDLEKRKATTGITKKDEENDLVYYPFTFFNSCLMDPKNPTQYQNEICEINKKQLKIPNDYLKKINYSLFHLNNIKNNCGNNLQSVEQKTQEYIKNLEKECDEFVNKYFVRENGLFIYNTDELKKFHDLVNQNFVEYEQLIEILKCLPIKLLQFYECYQPDKNNENKEILKYKVFYIYDFYKAAVAKFLNSHVDVNYENDKTIKPGSKGDSLEEKVINSFESNYFYNFRPDQIIEMDTIYDLSLYNVFEEEEKESKKYKDVINQLEKAFFQDKKLIMIKQKNSNAKTYDLAFLQKYKKGKYQFILIQITRNKEKTELEKYKNVNSDCYNFANFFSIFDNIEVKKYHFLFIIQGRNEQNQKSMIEFLVKNRINYIKFYLNIYDKTPIFTDSKNQRIDSLVFDNKSFTEVELINPKDDIDNLSSSSEYSLLGQKRQKPNKLSKTKYTFGITIYDNVKSILKCEKFELCKENYFLKENVYFYIYYKTGENKNKIYYLVYLKNGRKKIQIIKNTKGSINQIKQNISEKDLKDTRFKCFKMIKKEEKLSS